MKKQITLFLMFVVIGAFELFAQTDSNETLEYNPAAMSWKYNDDLIDRVLLKYGDKANAAENGDKKAIIFLADEYNKRQEKSPEAIKWYSKAAEIGEVEYMKKMGYLYMQGGAIGQDYSKAMFWHKKAAEKGDAGAMVSVGYIYLYGYGDVGKDTATAEMWFEKAIKTDVNVENDIFFAKYAAENKTSDFMDMHIEAECDAKKAVELGDMYAKEEDYETAEYWYEKAIAKGGLQGELGRQHLAQMIAKLDNIELSSTLLIDVPEHLRGDKEITKDLETPKEAEEAFNKSGQQLQQNVDYAIQEIKEVTDPYASLRQRAENGDREAMFQLASRFYVDDQNYKEAYKWFIEAAKKSDNDAMFALYGMLQENQGVPSSISEKKRLSLAGDMLQMAADSGNISAMYYCGALSFYGSNKPYAIVGKNDFLAEKFLKQVPYSSEYYFEAQKILALIAEKRRIAEENREHNKAIFSEAFGNAMTVATQQALHVGVAAGLEKASPGAGSKYLEETARNTSQAAASSAGNSQSKGSGKWRIKVHDDYKDYQKMVSRLAGVSYPNFVNTGYFDITFNSKQEAEQWIKDNFAPFKTTNTSSDPERDRLYIEKKIGTPVEIP